MLSKHQAVRLSLWVVILGLVAASPMFAGSAVVGSVAGSMNATVGGQTLFPNTTLFSGDSLQVKDGVAVVALGSASRLVFGRDTMASFLRDSNEVTVLLGQGNVSVFHDADGMPVRMKVGSVSVVPVSGFKTLGEVATLNGAVVVTAKEGVLRVEGDGQTVNVAKGKTITLVPRANAPQPQNGPPPGGNSAGRVWHDYLGWSATILSAVAVALAGADLSRSGTAQNNASAAESAAAAAASAAAAAASAAAAAESAAINAANCAADVLAKQESPSAPLPYPCTT